MRTGECVRSCAVAMDTVAAIRLVMSPQSASAAAVAGAPKATARKQRPSGDSGNSAQAHNIHATATIMRRRRSSAGAVTKTYQHHHHHHHHHCQHNKSKLVVQQQNGSRCCAMAAPHAGCNGDSAGSNGLRLAQLGEESLTREIYTVLNGRLGQPVPSESVRGVFNALQLYPTDNCVNEMLKCAKSCTRKQRPNGGPGSSNGGNSAANYHLKVSELAFYAREMRNRRAASSACNRDHAQQQHLALQRRIYHGTPSVRPTILPAPTTVHNANITNHCSSNCEVFLGGSCNPTTWRMDTAIPELKKHGITYYNPQVSMWAPELVAKEHDAKQSASLLLYVVDSQTRSVAGMIEVAYLVAGGRCVVLVAYPYREGQSIMGEPISNGEYVDLVNGQTSLLALVKSHGIKVHKQLSAALQCTAHILRNSSITADEQVVEKLQKLRDVFDTYDTDCVDAIPVNAALIAYRHFTGRPLARNQLLRYLRAINAATSSSNTLDNVYVSFEQFCAIVAEFHDETKSAEVQRASRSGYINNQQHHDWVHNANFRNLSELGVREMQYNDITSPVQLSNSYHQRIAKSNNTNYTNDVFLGGSCRHSDGGQFAQWRQQVAVPLLTENGLTFVDPSEQYQNNNMHFSVLSRSSSTNNSSYNSEDSLSDCESESSDPQQQQPAPNHQQQQEEKRRLSPATGEGAVLDWKRSMDRCRVLVFVIGADRRALTTMIMAAYHIGLGRPVVLCVAPLSDDDSSDVRIDDEILSKQAIKDYNRGRVYLTDLAKRKQVPVFENVTDAIRCVIAKCRPDGSAVAH